MPNPPPRRNRLATNQRAQTVVHYTPNTPCHPHTTEVDCTLSNHSGGFATIDPRHAGDTPQGSAYGSNSPQATNEDDPHHTNTRDIPPATTPPATSPPSTQPPRPNRRPLHPENPISPACHRGGLHFEQALGGFCDHRPPTRRRHAARQRLW